MARAFGGGGRIFGGSAGTSLSKSYSDLVSEISESQKTRQGSIEELLDKIIDIYSPGGAFGKGYEKQLALQKVQDVGKTAQRDISRGLYGIRPYEQEWEATVGSTARLKLEDLRMQALAGAYGQKAGFLEGIQEPYPDYGALMNAYAASSSVPSGGGGGGSTYGGLTEYAFGTGGGGAKGTGETLRGLGGMPGEYSGPNITAEQGGTYGNLLGTFSPEKTNVAMGNIPTGQTTTPQQQITPTDALKMFSTYEAYKSWAEAQGGKAGSEREWAAARRRVT